MLCLPQPTHVMPRDEYDKTTSVLKKAYKAEIMGEHDVFSNYGWIHSDFCPDGFDFDGKSSSPRLLTFNTTHLLEAQHGKPFEFSKDQLYNAQMR